MFMRVLVVSLTQVLRSIAIILLPISFLALIAWATAGSATGNTVDPMRAALWIWLGTHHIPFSLALPPSGIAGFLSYLPLGALLLPILAVRSGFKRTMQRLDGDTSLLVLARTLFSLLYSLIATLLAFFSATESINPVWYLVPAIILPATFITTLSVGRSAPITQAIFFGSRIMALLLGLSSIVFGISLLLNISTVKDLTQVLQPGILGGFLLLLINIAYIPNCVVATLSYLSGAGFAVGAGTLVSPISYNLGKIPAIPLLGALPTGKFTLALFAIVVIILTGALLTHWTLSLNTRIMWQSFFIVIVITLLLAALSSGSLVTDAMGTVGVSIWQFTLALTLELGIGIALATYLPRIRIRRSS